MNNKITVIYEPHGLGKTNEICRRLKLFRNWDFDLIDWDSFSPGKAGEVLLVFASRLLSPRAAEKLADILQDLEEASLEYELGFVALDLSEQRVIKKYEPSRFDFLEVARPFGTPFSKIDDRIELAHFGRIIPEKEIDSFLSGEYEERVSKPPAPKKSSRVELSWESPPNDLVSAIASGECLLFLGTDYTRFDEYLTWAKPLVEPDKTQVLKSALEKGAYDLFAEELQEVIKENADSFQTFVKEIDQYEHLLSAPVDEELQKAGFAGVLTPMQDGIVGAVFGRDSQQLLVPADGTQILSKLTEQDPFVLQFFGMYTKPEALSFSYKQFERNTAANRRFKEVMTYIMTSRTVLFLDANLEEIEQFMDALNLNGIEYGTHFALSDRGEDFWQTKADSLQKHYGIRSLPFSGDGIEARLKFLNELTLKKIRGDHLPEQNDGPGHCESISLKQIGPFPDLNLDLDPRLNVLLGDNGVGKSTILRALALAICGKPGRRFALNLPAGTATEATIRLTTPRQTYLTTLTQSPDDMELEISPARPLDIEGWPVIAIPALRGVRATSQGVAYKLDGPAGDVLPLLAGDFDPRSQSLSEWLIQVDHIINQGDDQRATRYQTLVDKLFAVLNDIVHGFQLELDSIDPVNKKVWLRTIDGRVLLETISQGIGSVLSMVMVILKRMYDHYEKEPLPHNQFVLVLIDEIDAHLHPAWQRGLLSKLLKHFPLAQFIVTSHSSLVVAGLPSKQVHRLIREDGSPPRPMVTEKDMTMGRADQVLTGPLFDLVTTLDPQTTELQEEYVELLGLEQRNPKQEARFNELEKTLDDRIPSSFSLPEARRANLFLQSFMASQFGDFLPEQQADLLEKAKKYLESIERERQG